MSKFNIGDSVKVFSLGRELSGKVAFITRNEVSVLISEGQIPQGTFQKERYVYRLPGLVYPA